jgi:hypothetical protein
VCSQCGQLAADCEEAAAAAGRKHEEATRQTAEKHGEQTSKLHRAVAAMEADAATWRSALDAKVAEVDVLTQVLSPSSSLLLSVCPQLT